MNLTNTIYYFCQCIDSEGKQGCFFRNENDEQITKTYPNGYELFSSEEMQFLKSKYQTQTLNSLTGLIN